MNENIELEIFKIIDDDLNGVIKIIRSFIDLDLDLKNLKGFSGREKVAILLISLGIELSTNIIQHLTDEEIEILTLELFNMRLVLPESKEQVLNEFYQSYIAQQYIIEGGSSFAKNLLEKSFGIDKAIEITNRLTMLEVVQPFDWIRYKFNEVEIYHLLIDEDSETIAIVLSQLKSNQSSKFFNKISIDKQSKIINYLAETENIDLNYIKEIECRLEKKSYYILINNYLSIDGINTITEILSLSSRETEKRILEELRNKNELLYNDVLNKLFIFEDIIRLTNDDIKKVVNSPSVTDEDLILSLKVCSEELTKIILNNLVEEKKILIKYKMKQFRPAYYKDIEKAQQKIVKIIRELEEKNEILISRGDGDEIFF